MRSRVVPLVGLVLRGGCANTIERLAKPAQLGGAATKPSASGPCKLATSQSVPARGSFRKAYSDSSGWNSAHGKRIAD